LADKRAAFQSLVGLFLLALAIAHIILLAAERDEIAQNGRLVEVSERSMHIYIEGK
jgi:hypothetical protein